MSCMSTARRQGSRYRLLPDTFACRLPDRTVELPAGQLLVLDQCVPHDVEAEEDSAFLLTLHGKAKNAETL